jgi:uncharacterized membrane protein
MTRWFAVAVVLTLAALGASGYVYYFMYDRLPDLVPTHWNASGAPDAWTPKDKIFPTFLLMPAVMGGILVLTLLLPWLSPRQFEVESFRAVWEYVMFLTTALMGYIHVVILLGSLGMMDLTTWLLAGMFLFFGLIGNVLGKVRRNFWMGVRTPWTLASDLVWERTHRLAAWLFVAAGVVGFVAVLARVPFYWCFIGLMVAAFVPVFYSLYLYKRLQREGKLDGEPAAQTSSPV